VVEGADSERKDQLSSLTGLVSLRLLDPLSRSISSIPTHSTTRRQWDDYHCAKAGSRRSHATLRGSASHPFAIGTRSVSFVRVPRSLQEQCSGQDLLSDRRFAFSMHPFSTVTHATHMQCVASNLPAVFRLVSAKRRLSRRCQNPTGHHRTVPNSERSVGLLVQRQEPPFQGTYDCF
jgi:hypothetical protein